MLVTCTSVGQTALRSNRHGNINRQQGRPISVCHMGAVGNLPILASFSEKCNPLEGFCSYVIETLYTGCFWIHYSIQKMICYHQIQTVHIYTDQARCFASCWVHFPLKIHHSACYSWENKSGYDSHLAGTKQTSMQHTFPFSKCLCSCS